ncbi:MAG TPA: DPP IV N-terminal domain-containing protein, partial [Gemmatimonadales bacterium]
GSRDFQGETFGPARWLGEGSAYTTLEPAPSGGNGRNGRDLVKYDTERGTREVLVSSAQLTPPGAVAPLTVDAYAWSPDQKRLLIFTNSKQVWRLNTRGDYWVLDRESGQLRQLGRFAKPSTLMYAQFSPDGRRVGYVVANNLYVEDLSRGTVIQLTRDGSRTIINGNFDWVYEEEFGLHDGWRWSPDGRRIAYWQLDASGVRDFLLIRNNDSLYSQTVPIQYPKAGETNSAVRIGVVPATGGETTWLRLEGDSRNYYLARMEWAASSDALVVQKLNRLQNTLDLLLAEVRTGEVRPILVEGDSAWVEVVDDLHWLDRGRRFTWVSERDGWTHVYVVSRDGRETRLLTPGDYDVLGVTAVDEKAGWLYYIASPDDPAQRYLWRARLDGKGVPQRVSPPEDPGTHGYTPSPNARWAFHTYSRFGQPPATDLVRLTDHQPIRILAANAALRDKVAALEIGPVEFLTIPGADGSRLNAWIMKPPDFDPARKYPILFQVYGGPGSQTVVDGWGGSQRLWHLMLSQKGYLVASVDNRGTGARGRAFRKVVYGQLGVIETRDQAAAAAEFAKLPYVDPARVGIWGWSYGGFMSLNALFQAADVYQTAISVAPVSHWKYYDTIYTERYNGLPQENPEGYDRGSPLRYAGQLRGNLLLVHGSGDDNVHYQNTEALVNALVAAKKPFQMMVYPDRNHGISGGATSQHLYELMTRYLDEHLMGRTALTP